MLEHSPIDRLLAALADPTRREIVERLGRAPAGASHLVASFDMSLAAVVQHLQQLEAAGIVTSEKPGRVRIYRLAAGGLAPLARWIDDRRGRAERELDRLGHFLEPDDPADMQRKE